MALNKNSPSYMKGYLKHALEFEKFVYIWSQAMDGANNRIKVIYSERKRLEDAKASITYNLSTLSDKHEQEKRRKTEQAARYRKNCKVALAAAVLILFGLFIFGAVVANNEFNDPTNNITLPKETYIPLIAFAVSGSFSTVIIPAFIGIFIYNRRNAIILEKEVKQLAEGSSERRQELILRARESETDNDWAVNVIEESVISQRQEEIHEALMIARKHLAEIYSINVLPAKYRNLSAVATMYEYLATGRCNTVTGHGGIYDTYEVERVELAKLWEMVKMNATLERIEDNQRYMCQELRRANRTLSSINASLGEIEKSSAEIAKNTAISAAANQQTAAAAQWLAWKTWADG